MQQRLTAASTYFIGQIDELMQVIQKSPAVTDSRQHAKAYNEAIKEVFSLLAEKKHLMNSCLSNFAIDKYYQQKKSFKLPPFGINAYATTSYQKIESPHPQLHRKLRELRNKICEQKNLPIYYVASGNSIDEMAEYLPQNLDELVKIGGFGKAKAKLYGNQFLEIITDYCKGHRLGSSIDNRPPKRDRKERSEQKEDTRSITYKLFKEGNTSAQISKLRNLAVSTIESHLEFFVRKGIILMNELVKREKLILIEAQLQDFEGSSITPIKEKLGEAVSFGEIRMVIAAREWEKIQEKSS
jgi:hypothetical protein